MKPSFSLLSMLFCLLLLWTVSCKKDSDPTPGGGTTNPGSGTTATGTAKSSAKAITAFAFNGLNPAVTATIAGTTISATVATGTDVTKLVPTITVSDKATVSPGSGVAQDLSKAVTYTVTAEDGSTQTYTVTVIVAGTGNTGTTLTSEIVYLKSLALNLSDGTIKSNSLPDLDDASTDGNNLITDALAINIKGSGYVGMVANDVATKSQKWANTIRVERYKRSSIENGVLYTYVNGFYADKVDRLMAFEATTGAKKWEVSLGTSNEQSLSSNPVLANGVCYVSNRNGTVAVNTATGKIKWEMALSATTISADLVVNTNTIITSHDYFLTALDAETGVKKWEIKLSKVVRNLTSASDLVFVDDASDIMAFDIRSGAGKWTSTGNGSISRNTVYHNGTVIVKASSAIHVIDASTGNLTKKISISFYSNNLVVADNVIYVCGSEGNTIYTYAYNLNGSLKWKTASVGSGALFVITGGKTYYESLSGMTQ